MLEQRRPHECLGWVNNQVYHELTICIDRLNYMKKQVKRAFFLTSEIFMANLPMHKKKCLIYDETIPIQSSFRPTIMR